MRPIRPAVARLTLAALLALLLCAGCATPPLVPSGFLNDYEPLRPDAADPMVLCSDYPTSGGAVTHVVFLRDVQMWPDAEMTESNLADEMREVFRERLRMWVLEAAPPGVLVVGSAKEAAPYRRMPGVGVLVVDSALTHLGKGFGLGRYLIGFGVGDATATAELRATQVVAGGGVVHQAVVFGRSHGNPHSGLNPRALSGRYSVRLACDAVAKRAAARLVRCLKAPGEEWWTRPVPAN